MSQLAKFLEQDVVKQKFERLLGNNSKLFLTSLLQVCTENTYLQNADSNSVYQAAMMAASLQLPINRNLGFAYIVPYGVKQKDGSYKQVAQFQLG